MRIEKRFNFFESFISLGKAWHHIMFIFIFIFSSTSDKCGKTIVQGSMDAEMNNVIYMELYSGPKMAHAKCGKTNVAGSIDR
jgi:hypothetical protein